MSSSRLDEIHTRCVDLRIWRNRFGNDDDVVGSKAALLRGLVFEHGETPENSLRDLLEAAKEDAYARLLRHRGVEEPCPTCRGLGTRGYGSGSTWRGGMGTAAYATDVCDTCWGTGDASRVGVDLRKLEAARDAWEDTQAVQYFGRSVGISYAGAKERLEELAKLCEKQSRKRSGPGAGEFWYVQGWDMTAAVLRRIVKGARDE